MFQEGAVNIKGYYFLSTVTKAKGHAMMESPHEMEIKKDEHEVPEGEPDLDLMA